MGVMTMLTANGPLYRDVQGLDFRVLMYLAQKVLDEPLDERPARTYWGGIAAIINGLYDLNPDDDGYQNAYRRIQRSISNLVQAGALKRVAPAVKHQRAHYEVCPLQGLLPHDLKASLKHLPTQSGTTFRAVSGTTFRAVPTARRLGP